MNLKGFKKVHEDEHKAILKNQQGHEIKIAKKGLTGKHLKDLEGLTLHASEGWSGETPEFLNDYEQSGPHNTPEVEGEQARASLNQNDEDIKNALLNATGGAEGWKRASDKEKVLEPAKEYSDTLPPQDVSSADRAPTEESPAQEPEQPVETQQPLQPTQPAPQRAPYMQEAPVEASNYYNDLRNGHITPETYNSLFAKKDTPGKIGTLFGLLLSGAGSGLAHQPNMVMQMMDNEINRDFEAQKTNKANALNFYNLSNQHEFQKAQIDRFAKENNLTAAQVQNMKMDTELKGLQAGKERTLLTGLYTLEKNGSSLPPGNFKNQYDSTLNGLKTAASAKMQQDRGVVASQLSDPENQFQNQLAQYRKMEPLMSAMGKVADTMEERHFTGSLQTANRKISDKDRGDMESLNNLSKSYVDGENYLKKVGTLGPIIPSGLKAEGEALQNRMELEIGHLEGLGRFTPEEAKRYKGMIPDLTGTHFTNQDLNKIRSLQREVAQHRETIYDSYGVNGNRNQGFSNAAAEAWLKANPNDKRAAKIKQILGK